MKRVILERDVAVPTRAGFTLMSDLYRPDDDDAHPVLLQRTPYDRTQPANAFSAIDPFKMALAGYVVVVQDVRGRFGSEGQFISYKYDAEDGEDTIAWIAEQPWCDGNVGMFGLSYMAQVQLLAASTSPPALRAIAPIQSPGGLTGGDRYRGGALSLGLLASWAMGTIVPAEILRQAKADPNRYAEFPSVIDDIDNLDAHMSRLPLVPWPPMDDRGVDHGRMFDRTTTYEFWPPIARFDPTRLPVPALIIAGWYDVVLQPDLDLFQAMKSDAAAADVRRLTRLVVGPWSHGTPTATVGQLEMGFRTSPLMLDIREDVTALHRRWFDARLRGEASGIDDEAPVKLFVMGVNRWRDEPAWPLARAQERCWHVRAGGGLSEAPPSEAEAPSTFALDPQSPVPTWGGGLLMTGKYGRGPQEQARTEAHPDVLVFSSDPLEAPLEVTGAVKFVAWIAAETPDTDIVVRLCDVHPDGRSYNVVDGIQRLQYRDGPEPSLLKPGEVYRVAVDLWSTSQVFLPGHRLRVQVCASDFPRYDRNTGTGELSAHATAIVPQRNLLFHDRARPSQIVLPVIPA